MYFGNSNLASMSHHSLGPGFRRRTEGRGTSLLSAFVLLLALASQAFAAPAITALSPDTQAAHGPQFTLTVTGTGFASDAVVVFGATVLTPTTPATATSVSVVVPATALQIAPAAIPVIVRNPTADPVENSAPVNFTLSAAAAPVITSISPDRTAFGAGDVSLLVQGTGFLPGAQVKFGATLLSPTDSSTTSLSVTVAASLLQPEGAVIQVQVVNEDTQASNALNFTVASPPPVLSMGDLIRIPAAPASTHTLTLPGTGFKPTSTVRVIHQAVAPGGLTIVPDSATANTIQLTLPATFIDRIGALSFQVSNPDGQISGQRMGFVVPAIYSITPESVVAGSPAFRLTVNGYGMLPDQTQVNVGPTSLQQVLVNSQGTQVSGLLNESALRGAAEMEVTIFSIGAAPSDPLIFRVLSAGDVSIQTPEDLGTSVVGISRTVQLVATAGTAPYTWSLAPGSSLPAGLTLGASGQISGTTSIPGSYSFTAIVTDGASVPTTAQRTFQLQVVAFEVETSTLPQARVGVEYSGQLRVTGLSGDVLAQVTWELVNADSLPAGLSLNTTTGLVSGKPEPIQGLSQTFNVQVRARFSNGLTTPVRIVSLTVVGGGLDVSVQTLPAGAVGQVYGGSANGFTIRAINGTAPYTIDLTPESLAAVLATGLQVARPAATTPAAVADIRLQGSPTSGGEVTVVLVLKDSVGTEVRRTFNLSIVGTQLTISPGALPSATVNVAFEQALSLTGMTEQESSGSITWQLQNAPAGLTLSTGGVLRGTFTAQGSHTFSVVATTSMRSVTKQYTLQVTATPPVIETTTLPSATVGNVYEATITASGGTPGYTWQISGVTLPAGLSFAAETVTAASLRIAGTPTASAESRTFTLGVRDSAGQTTSRAFTIGVSALPIPTLTIQSLGTGGAAQQSDVVLNIAQGYPLSLSGTATVAFEPNATNNADDPQVRFLSGSRSATFVIQPNTTAAVFPNISPQKVQTGTVAGKVRVSASIQGASETAVQELDIPRLAPVILDGITVQSTSGGFTVVLTGYSTPRDLASAQVTFVPVSGSNLQTTQVTVPLTEASTTWFNSAAGQSNGSSFRLSLPFTVQGGSNAVQSVSVTLTNSVGASNTRSASF